MFRKIMTLGLSLVLLAPAGMCFVGINAAAEQTVLLIAGGPSNDIGAHEHAAGCLLLQKAINEHVSGLNAKYSLLWPEDPAAFEDVDAIVIFADGGRRHMIMDHLDQVGELMGKGVGLMCIHYAVEVPWGAPGMLFCEWIGGYYETHWSINPNWVADAKLNEEHPISNGVKPFSLLDEWYFNMRFRGNNVENVISILQAVPDDEGRSGKSASPRGPKLHIVEDSGESETLMWAVEREDSGRGVGFTGAHFHSNWQNDDIRKLVVNAIAWVSKVDVPEDGFTRDEILDMIAYMQSGGDQQNQVANMAR